MGAQTAVSGANAQGVETSGVFIKIIQDKSKSFLGKVISMDKSAVSMHTPETKRIKNNC